MTAALIPWLLEHPSQAMSVIVPVAAIVFGAEYLYKRRRQP